MAEWNIYEGSDYSLDDAFGARLHKLQDICQRMSELQHSRYSRLDAVRFEIATGLYIISTEKLYIGSAYKNMQEVGKSVLNFTSMTTTSYVRVARKFLDKTRPVSVFAENNRDFNMTQLIELSKLSVDEVKEMLEAGTVTFDMSAVDVKAAVRAVKEQQAKDIQEAKEAAMRPFEAAHEAFHKAYNTLKEHLEEMDDKEGSEILLPEIMGAVVDLYQEGLKGLSDK